MNLKEKIRDLAAEFYPEILQNRCHLHQNPELSFHEYQTAEFIIRKLSEYKIEYQSNIADTGVVGWIFGKNPANKMIALRADTDALPIEEENDVPYRSVHHGVMHACGHDVHTASLLGTARILNQLRNEFEGTVMLIFQPSEEKLPGGAKRMIDSGIFDERKPEVILAQHVFPALEAGYVGFRPGMYMASSDELYVTVRGKGGHGAIPHQVADPILIASHIIVAMQQIVSRNADAAIPTVLSFGKITSNGGATNIIPSEVNIEGTFRTMNENWRAQAHQRMIKLAQSIAEGMGAECEFIIKKGFPFLVNDEAITARAIEFAGDFLGSDKISGLDLRMTSEDFSYYTLEYPCTYYRLGGKKPGEVSFPLHSSRFDIDENALETGPALMAYLAVSFLEKSNVNSYLN